MRVFHNFSLLRFVFFVYAIWIFPLHVYFLIITWLFAQRRKISVLIKALDYRYSPNLSKATEVLKLTIKYTCNHRECTRAYDKTRETFLHIFRSPK